MSSKKPSRNEPNGALVRTLGNQAPAVPTYYPTVPYVNAAVAGSMRGEERLGLSHYGRILARRKWMLLCFALLGGAAAFLFSRAQTPLYRARTLVEIQSINEDFLNTRSVNPTSRPLETSDNIVQTQSTVLQSRPVLERAIDKLDIEARLVRGTPASWLSRLGWSRPSAEKEAASPRDQALAMIITIAVRGSSRSLG